MSARSRSSVIAALLVLVAAACGSDSVTTSTTSVETATTAPSTTTTTTTTTTTPTTSVPAVVAPGWSAVERKSVSSKAFPPCCGDTWHGAVSPALAPAAQPLADGPYAVTGQWPDDPTQPLKLQVFRFEQCALLQKSPCEPQGSQFAPTDLGVDTSASRPLTLALDDRVRAVVVGWDDATLKDDKFVIEQATGTALAELATVVDRAYTDVFADRFAAGENPDAIIADVRANPTGGFSPTPNGFVFTPKSGPPLLFQNSQSIFPYVDGQRVAGRGADVLAIRSIDVVDGQVTVYLYAGYYP